MTWCQIPPASYDTEITQRDVTAASPHPRRWERGRVGAAPINPAGTAGGSCGPLPALLEPCHRLAWPLSAK